MNAAARIAQYTVTRPKRVLIGWLGMVAVLVTLGTLVGTRQLSDNDAAVGQSRQALDLLTVAGLQDRPGESILVANPARRADDPEFTAVVADVAQRLGHTAGVEQVFSPLQPGGQQLISGDRHTALIQLQLGGSSTNAAGTVKPTVDAVLLAARAHPGYRIEQFGTGSARLASKDSVDADFTRAELLSVPLTLLILVLTFGALVAASVPVALALTAVLGTLGLWSLVSHLLPSSDATQSVILLLGMAIGVDYCLFYLRRYREERARGADSRRAVLTAAATSGHTVLVAGATVLVAMSGMLLAGDQVFASIGAGTMLAVLVTVLGALTVLPPILDRFGPRLDTGRLPGLGRGDRAGTGRGWNAVLTAVLRRPAVSALAATAVLAVLALPAISMHTKLPGIGDLPKDLPIVETQHRLQQAFPGAADPASVVVQAPDVTTPTAAAAIRALGHRAVEMGLASQPGRLTLSRDHTVARVDLPLVAGHDDQAQRRAIDTLTRDVLPATAAAIPGARVLVTGEAAANRDYDHQLQDRTPLVFAFVLGLAFLLLLVTFRSIVIPIKAIALNLLSVAASYGVLVAVFQYGWGAGLIGATTNGTIVSWLPLFLFVVLFGLSTDYHVFILSRAKELVDNGTPTRQAVPTAIRATARTVTSAAAVMVGVFSIFGVLRAIDLKQTGVGLAVAVLLDATLVRAVLLPALMQLLGEWNWYLPRWLHWLPNPGAPTTDPTKANQTATHDPEPAAA
jgi:putative drug exporter of the RND superfamily